MRSPGCGALTVWGARGMSLPPTPENSTHAAPARDCTARRVSSALRSATAGDVTATTRTSSRFFSRVEKSGFSVAEASHKWAPKAMAAMARRKKARRDTSGVAGDPLQSVEDQVLVQFEGERERGRELRGRASRENDKARRAPVRFHRGGQPVDGAGAGEHRAAPDFVRRAVGKLAHPAVRFAKRP